MKTKLTSAGTGGARGAREAAEAGEGAAAESAEGGGGEGEATQLRDPQEVPARTGRPGQQRPAQGELLVIPRSLDH